MRDGSRQGRSEPSVAANDNGTAEARVQTAAFTLARLLGRQIAREQFGRPDYANDNLPVQEARNQKE